MRVHAPDGNAAILAVIVRAGCGSEKGRGGCDAAAAAHSANEAKRNILSVHNPALALGMVLSRDFGRGMLANGRRPVPFRDALRGRRDRR